MAYPYITQSLLDTVSAHSSHVRFVVDSGAFTAWKAGKSILIDDYCTFLHNLPIKPWRYFTLDVVGNPEGSYKNYEIMLRRGFKPIPIFTRGEDPKALETYYQTSDVVGIGGLVATKGNKGFVKGIMNKVGKRNVHWLGFTNLSFLKHYKPYMADSSSWEMGGRFGAAPLYLGGGHLDVLRKKECIPPKKITPEKVRALQTLGFSEADCYKQENWSGGDSLCRNLGGASYVKLSLDVENKIGTKLFLAVATDQGVKILLKQFYNLRGINEKYRSIVRRHGLGSSPELGVK